MNRISVSLLLLSLILLFSSCESPVEPTTPGTGTLTENPDNDSLTSGTLDNEPLLKGALQARIAHTDSIVRFEVFGDTTLLDHMVFVYKKVDDTTWSKVLQFSYRNGDWSTELDTITEITTYKIEAAIRDVEYNYHSIGELIKTVDPSSNFTLGTSVNQQAVTLSYQDQYDTIPRRYKLYHSLNGTQWETVLDTTMRYHSRFYDIVSQSGTHYYRLSCQKQGDSPQMSSIAEVTVSESEFDFPFSYYNDDTTLTCWDLLQYAGINLSELYFSADSITWIQAGEKENERSGSYRFNTKANGPGWYQLRGTSRDGTPIFSSVIHQTPIPDELPLTVRYQNSGFISVDWKHKKIPDTTYYYFYRSRDGQNWEMMPNYASDEYTYCIVGEEVSSSYSAHLEHGYDFGDYYFKLKRVAAGVTSESKVVSYTYVPYPIRSMDFEVTELGIQFEATEYDSTCPLDDFKLVVYRSKDLGEPAPVDTVSFERIGTRNYVQAVVFDTPPDTGFFGYYTRTLSVSTGLMSDFNEPAFFSYEPVPKLPTPDTTYSTTSSFVVTFQAYFVEKYDSLIIYRSETDSAAMTVYDTLPISSLNKAYRYSYYDRSAEDLKSYTYAAAILSGTTGEISAIGTAITGVHDGRYASATLSCSRYGDNGVRIGYDAENVKSSYRVYLYRSESADVEPVLFDSLKHSTYNSTSGYFIDTSCSDLKTYYYKVSYRYDEKVSHLSDTASWTVNADVIAPEIRSAKDKGDFVEIQILVEMMKSWPVVLRRSEGDNHTVIDTLEGSSNGLITTMDYPETAGTFDYSAALITPSGTTLPFGEPVTVTYTQE